MTVIDPIASRTANASAGTPVDNPAASLDRDAFLKLLVAQLKYQDPTNPADASQITAQSAQLTMVDRLNEMAESFQSANALARMSLASSLVGKDVSFLDNGAYVWARVDGVSIDGDDVILSAGGRAVPFEAVGAVLAPPTSQPAGTPAA